MVTVDIPMPTSCSNCVAMRCQKCIISDSKTVLEYQVNKSRPDWCPIKSDMQNVLDTVEKKLETIESLTYDEWFRGQRFGLEFVLSLLTK